MGKINFTQILIAMIHFYRFALSLLLGPCCRFEPSCACYAVDALKLHGLIKGSYYIFKRLLRCHPWQPGGFDPVPNRTRLC